MPPPGGINLDYFYPFLLLNLVCYPWNINILKQRIFPFYAYQGLALHRISDLSYIRYWAGCQIQYPTPSLIFSRIFGIWPNIRQDIRPFLNPIFGYQIKYPTPGLIFSWIFSIRSDNPPDIWHQAGDVRPGIWNSAG